MSDNHEDLPPAKKPKIDRDVTLGEPSSSKEPCKSPERTEREFEENFVSVEEVAKLREFQVLDEVKSNDEDSQAEEESDDSSDGEPVLPDEEIEKMLEADLPEDFKTAPKPKEKPYVTREKVILEEKGVNHFEVLPLDWIMIRHHSGIPVYVHRSSRVCTLAKPYFLGKGNAKRHEIPISAIPCLAYRRALEEEETQKEIDKKIEEHIKQGYPFAVPNLDTLKNDTSKKSSPDNVKVDEKESSNSDSTKEQKKEDDETEDKKSPPGKCPFKAAMKDKEDDKETSEDVCPKENDNDSKSSPNKKDETAEGTNNNILSDIPASRQPVVLPGGIVMQAPRVETVQTNWKSQHLSNEQVYDYCKNLFKFKVLNIMHFKRWADRRKYTKARKALQYPMMPEGTKLITIPAQSTGTDSTGAKTVKRDWVMNMNGRSYLSVFHEYVRRALQKQPVYEFKQLENAATPYQATVYIGGMQYGVGHGSSKRQAKSAAARASIQILIPEMRDHLEPDNEAEPDFVFFDYVGIEDPRIAEFCAATCEPTPHAILRTCLLRNFGAGDRHIQIEMKKLEYQKIELTMKVGKHSATVVCKNKKTAKQRASQAILQALHPHVRSWGSLLRLYGSRSVKSCKERKLEEQQITLLQDKARRNEPNRAVLEKLRHEMRRLRARDAALAPLGTLLASSLPDHSGSNLNNVEL